MKFLVSLYTEADTEINRIENTPINANAPQEAVDLARKAFPGYEPYKVVLLCTDWS